MEDAKKNRSKKAGMVTRRVNELLNAIKMRLYPEDVKTKIGNLTYTMDELGAIHDEVNDLITDTANSEGEEAWYSEYDCKVNRAIKEARKYIEENRATPATSGSGISTPIKLKRLELFTFNSDHKEYHKWKQSVSLCKPVGVF